MYQTIDGINFFCYCNEIFINKTLKEKLQIRFASHTYTPKIVSTVNCQKKLALFIPRLIDPYNQQSYLVPKGRVFRLKLNRKQIIAIKTKYPNSLELSKQNKAHLAVHEKTGDLMVVGSNGNSDFPIHYGNGKMGYDHVHPKFIHTEIKKLHKIN